jgi:glutamine synthetase
MSTLRFRVVEKAFQAKPFEVPAPAERPSEYFGKYVFNREKMFKYLPSKVFEKRWITAQRSTGALPMLWQKE